jgi:hypothetical protein
MDHLLEYTVVTILVLLGLTPLWLNHQKRGNPNHWWVITALLGISWCMTNFLLHERTADVQLSNAVPRVVNHDDYVGAQTCVACHQDQHKSWFASYHRTMTQIASPVAIQADFDGRELKMGQTTYKLFMQDDQYWVRTPHPKWAINQDPVQIRDHPKSPMSDQRIVMVTGSHKMQMFWISLNHSDLEIDNPAAESPDDDLQQVENNTLTLFPWVYVIANKHWIPYEDSFIVDPSFGRPPTFWNSSCIVCHSVAGRPTLISESIPSFDTKVVDLGIACEACHGPGKQHVDHFQNPLTRYKSHLSADTAPSYITNPSRLDKEQQTQVCAQCHSLFEAHSLKNFLDKGMGFKPGTNIAMHHELIEYETLEKDTPYYNMHWNDGSIRIGGREFQGMSKSECYLNGEMTCLSCHSIHSMQEQNDLLGKKMESNHACVQCHQESQYTEQIESHTHHQQGTVGSLCYNCHMPHTSYALMGGIRSHQIDIPRVTTVQQNEKPNACNLCHLDKPLQWTADTLTQWYGHDAIELDPTYQNTAAAIVWIMQGHAIHRTLAAWHMSWEPTQKTSAMQWRFPYLLQLLNDNYSATRYVTWQSLNRIPSFTELQLSDNSYDFIDPQNKRINYQQTLLNRWSNLMGHHAEQRSELLIKDGALDSDAILKLYEKRDNTKILMSE